MSNLPAPTIRRNHESREGGEACPPSAEQLIRATTTALTNCQIPISHSKISRIVRTYLHKVHDKGVPYLNFLLVNVQISAEQRCRIEDDLYRLTYADPTGETAARHVDRERGSAT